MSERRKTFHIWIVVLFSVGCFSSLGCHHGRYGCQPRSYYTYPANTGGCCAPGARAVVPSSYYAPQTSNAQPQPAATKVTAVSGWVTAKPTQ